MLNDEIIAALIALLGVFISLIVSLLVTIVNNNLERKRTNEIWQKEKYDNRYKQKVIEILRIESYLLGRARMIKILNSKEYNQYSIKDEIMKDHLNYIGEHLYCKQILKQWNKENIIKMIDEIELNFNETLLSIGYESDANNKMEAEPINIDELCNDAIAEILKLETEIYKQYYLLKQSV